MRAFAKLIAVTAVAGLPLLGGCSSDGCSDNYRSSRTYDPSYRTTRTYDPDYRASRTSRTYDYDTATQAGSSRGPWRDEDGRLHHPPGWKAASDRGRLSNDRDDRAADRYYDRY